MTDRTSSRNEAGVFEPFSAEEVPWEAFERGRFGSRWKGLSRFGGGSHVGVALEELPPGKTSNRLHYHMLEEEHVFVLEGALWRRPRSQTTINRVFLNCQGGTAAALSRCRR